MSPTNITHALAVFGLFGLIWTIQLVHYPMFKLIEAPHWPRFHRYHSRNISFIVFPLMLVELLTSLQLFLGESTFTHNLSLACAVTSWLLTIVVFIPLHNKVASRPIPDLLQRLVRLNWLRTFVWTLATANVFVKLVSVSA